MASMTSIRIRGARTHNLKNIDLDIPRDQFVGSQGFLDQANLHWPLTPSMQKDKGVMLSPYQLMLDNFYLSWKSPM